MSIRYDSRRESLAEVIRKATVNATLVIPDLQRPYVWTPRQVVLLVDSLFKGWPFGSLLLWEVKPDCFHDNEGIPNRPFWQVVDRTDAGEGSSTSPMAQPTTYQMVLDGQQRIQSLVLALGGDQWGFQLYDADWAQDLQERRLKASNHWSRGSLCLDLTAFSQELAEKGGKVRKLESGKMLDWVILDPVHGRSSETRPPGYVGPLPVGKDNPGRFIRLSRIWELAQRDLSEEEYEGVLAPVLSEHSVGSSASTALSRPLAQFMKIVEGVKNNSFVHALQIDSLTPTPQWSKDDYNDAIVNIFTRLNTAGRTLTREEITLAWLKVGWVTGATEGKTAGACLDELKQELAENGFAIETDDIVRLVSFGWAIDHREGALLDSKDLLKGGLVRPMAKDVSSTWRTLRATLSQGVEILSNRDLVENQGSFNAAIVFLTWHRLVVSRLQQCQRLKVAERDHLEKALAEKSGQFADRWIFGSQWASTWGEHAVRNFQELANELSKMAKELQNSDESNLLEIADVAIQRLMNRVAERALSHVVNFTVRERTRVHLYYSLLWVWHRLDRERWKYSSVPMRTGRRRTSKLEVDHTIADAWWNRLVQQLITQKQTHFTGPEEERWKLAPGDFKSPYEARSFINLLGNCLLLDKSFNISKSDGSMWSFLENVHEFINKKFARDKWEAAMDLVSEVTEPEGVDLSRLVKAIETRDREIREDLSNFVRGSLVRVDLEEASDSPTPTAV